MYMVTIARYFKQFWLQYALGITALLITNALSASVPFQIKLVLDKLGPSQTQPIQSIEKLYWDFGLIALTLVGMFFIRVCSRYFLIGVGRLVEYDLRKKLFAHLLELPQAFFDANPTGQLISRLSNDLSTFRIFMGGAMMLLFNVLFAFSMVPFLMWQLNWELTLYSFCIFPVVLVIALRQSRKLKQLTMTAQGKLGNISAQAEESFSGVEVIQAYTQENNFIQQFTHTSNQYRLMNIQLVRLRVVVTLIVAIIGSLSMALILGKGGTEVINQTLTLSSLAAFLLYLERLAWPTLTIGWILSSFQQGQASLQRINTVFAAKTDIDDTQVDNPINELTETTIHVKNLSFTYPQWSGLHRDKNTEKNTKIDRLEALNQISFTVEAGQLVCIVGAIGSGKSTLINLLARRYPVSNNTIFYGNTPIEKIPLAVLRKSIGLMSQQDFLFSMSIENNLKFSNPVASNQQISQAVELSALSADLKKLDDGLQTLVGERGVLLSGGQRQRTALSRTLLQTTKVLLLDDPFSNVDYETEQKILSGLLQRQHQNNKTTIVVTHRFSLAEKADFVIVLNQDGTLAGTGKHQQLLAECPPYKTLFEQDHSVNQFLEAQV